jgi:hypothetical protein
MTRAAKRNSRSPGDATASLEDPMPFSSELDAFLAKVQVRLDAAMGEAREELTAMAAEAERDLAALRQRFSAACSESPKSPEGETPSQSETSTQAEGDDQAG